MKKILRYGFERLMKRLGYTGDRRKSPFRDQRNLLNRDDVVVFDVGANRGRTIGVYLRRFPRARITAFEPIPAATENLRSSFYGDDRVKIFDFAIGATNEIADFHINQAEVQSSLLPISMIGANSYLPHQSTIEVKVRTLDQFCLEQEIPAIDILKMDIQGGELLALEGARTLLAAGAISLIYCEAWIKQLYKNAPLFHEISDRLFGHGYTLYDIYKPKRDSLGQIIKFDAIFISAQLQRQLDLQKPYWHSAGRRAAARKKS